MKEAIIEKIQKCVAEKDDLVKRLRDAEKFVNDVKIRLVQLDAVINELQDLVKEPKPIEPEILK